MGWTSSWHRAIARCPQGCSGHPHPCEGLAPRSGLLVGARGHQLRRGSRTLTDSRVSPGLDSVFSNRSHSGLLRGNLSGRLGHHANGPEVISQIAVGEIGVRDSEVARHTPARSPRVSHGKPL
jgi:hypothetical protein